MIPNEKTTAHRRAFDFFSIPDKFDSTSLSAYCYYGDISSPFRVTSTRPFAENRLPWPRSHLFNLNEVIEEVYPEITQVWDKSNLKENSITSIVILIFVSVLATEQ